MTTSPFMSPLIKTLTSGFSVVFLILKARLTQGCLFKVLCEGVFLLAHWSSSLCLEPVSAKEYVQSYLCAHKGIL